MQPFLTYDNSADQELYLSSLVAMEDRQVAIKAATMAGSHEKPNEDAFAATIDDDYLLVAVFDGATSLKPSDVFGDQTGARYASHFLRDHVSQSDRKESLSHYFKELNNALRESYAPLGLDTSDPSVLPAAVATLVKVTPESIDFAHSGDTFGVVYYRDGNSEVFTQNQTLETTDTGLALISQIADERNITPRQAREDDRVKQALVERRVSSHNNPDGSGVGVLNGDSNLEKYIQTGSIAIDAVETILVASDGLLPPGWSLKSVADRQKLLTTIQNGGFQHMFQVKRAVEDGDQDWHLVRYKHSDDATGVLITIS